MSHLIERRCHSSAYRTEASEREGRYLQALELIFEADALASIVAVLEARAGEIPARSIVLIDVEIDARARAIHCIVGV